MNQLDQKSSMSNRVKSFSQKFSSTLLIAVLFVIGAGSLSAQQAILRRSRFSPRYLVFTPPNER